MSNPNTRKSCVVPKCKNTTYTSPEKLFFIVPKNVKMRRKWIKAMKRLYPLGDKSTVYCCEDHFDIENDMESYVKYKLIGGRIKLKQGTVPHKFKCQQEKADKPQRSAVQKRNHIEYFSTLEKPEEILVVSCEDGKNLFPKKEQQGVCDGCLARDRRLTPVRGLRELLDRILNHDQLSLSPHCPAEPLFCWECSRLLSNVHKFQQKVIQVQTTLHLMASQEFQTLEPKSLSSLTATSNESFDYHIVHDEVVQQEITKSGTEWLEVNKYELNDSYEESQRVSDDWPVESSLVDSCKAERLDSDSWETLGSERTRKPKPRICQEEIPLCKVEKSYSIRKKNIKNVPDKYVKLVQPKMVQESFEGVQMSREEFLLVKAKKMRRKFKEGAHRCNMCGLQFTSRKLLMTHNRNTHDAKNQFECQICDARLPSDTLLTKHQSQHRLFKCNLCDSIFAEKRLLKQHSESHRCLYKCVKCKTVFVRRHMFDAHFRAEHFKYSCDHCGHKAISKRDLTKHIYFRHMSDSPVCRLCPRACSSFASLARHQAQRHPRGCVRAQDAYCVECNFAFGSRAAYTTHVARAHGQQRFECPDCGKVLKSEYILRNHRALRHTGRTCHYCQLCRKYFSHKSALRLHRASVHEKRKMPRKHICQYCSRGFAVRKTLVNHERTHTGERPYACAVCSAAFAQSAPLVTHARKQHGARGAWADVMREYRNIHVPT